jgi:uncharacterized protein DUF6603
MAKQAGTLETLALEVGKALKPLEDLLGPDIFIRLGLELPRAISGDANITTKLADAKNKVAELDGEIASLAAAITNDNPVAIVSEGVSLIATITALITKLEDVGQAVHNAAAGLSSAAEKAAVQQFAGTLAVRLVEYVSVGYLDEKMPTLTNALTILGIADKEYQASEFLEINHAPSAIVPRRLYLDRVSKLLSHPDQHLQEVFQWGTNSFDGSLLLTRAQALLESLEIPAAIYPHAGQPPVLEAFIFAAQADTSVNPPGMKFEVSLPGNTTFDRTVDFSDLWKGTVHVQANFAAGVEATIRPPFTLNAKPPTGNIALNVLLGLKAEKTATDPIVILSLTGGSRLQAESIGGSIGLDANIGTGGGEISPAIEVAIEKGKLIIDFSQGDGFIQKILSGIHLEAGFGLKGIWTPRDGLRLQGSGGVEVLIPIHLDLAVVSINALYFSVELNPAKPKIGLKTQFTTNLGPLTAVVDQLGTNVAISFPADGKGRLGLADINFEFAPPKGVGLSLDAGGFKGGGFLMLDPDKGEYAGALELDFKGLFSVKAIGIINTKMPDGSEGFSLLIVISAEFTPIQLSFGFTLNGVGGIFGLNRMIVVDALVEGIRTNAIKSILFPENIIANITRIISDIKQFFPQQKDHFVVGPMAKLGWGTPSIITVELGLLLDLPNPMFAIVGVLKAFLPTEDVGLLRLQVNFVGVLDFDHGYLFFRADLFDSHLLIYTITGSMAFLVSWGEAQTFALSVGGFHPDFRDIPTIPALPNGFRNMARIGLSLLSDDNPRLKVESYFAVTSNTVQFGARVELYAGAGGFNIYGFLGYDVLFQFDPFRFIAKLSGGIALRAGTSTIAGVTVSAQLSGPTPWDAQGEATLSLLFFDISVGFHVTWGDPPPSIPSATEDLLALLLREYADTRNWRAELPPNNHLHVSLRKIEPPAGTEMLVIHPAGVLTFSQRSLPLEDYLIQKFGTKKPKAENKFKLTNATSDGSSIPADFQGVREQFAPANFSELSDSEKLSRKSFEKLPSGFQLTSTSDLATTLPVVRPVDYELSYLRQKQLQFSGLFKLGLSAYRRLVKSSSPRQSVLAYQQNRISLNAPPTVALPKDAFAIASSDDLRSHVTDAQGPVLFATEAEAYQRQQELIADNPALAGNIQVISHYELNLN